MALSAVIHSFLAQVQYYDLLMKTLYLLRHAKSSQDDPELKDFERPLAVRGIKDLPIVAERFKARNGRVGCIICSPAVRTKTTAKMFAKLIGFSSDDVGSNPDLYFAGSTMFLKAASLLDDECESAMLVGHNPAITDFVNEMANGDINNIPTCGLVQLSLPIDVWSEIGFSSADLVEFDYPKKIENGR